MTSAVLAATSSPVAASLLDLPDERATCVGFSVHDASRLGWFATLPLPDERALDYRLDLELEMPANVFAPHSPWNQLQSLARLDSPDDPGTSDVTIDSLRRAMVVASAKLARASEGLARHCRAMSSVPAEDEARQTLLLWLDVALHAAGEARERLVRTAGDDPEHVARERLLADEYLNLQLLALLAEAGRALDEARRAAVATSDGRTASFDAIEARMVEAVEAELAYRRTQGFLCVDPTSAESLERYLDRAGRLKKHFNEVLYLDAETFQMSQRALHGISAVAGLCAAAVAFLFQLVLLQRAHAMPSAVGSGIAALALIAGVAYAVRDRCKDLGRDWLAEKLHRFYGQRVARYRAPARILRARPVVARARESFVQHTALRPDPLNPHSSASAAVTTLRFLHKGTILAQPGVVAFGARQVKHVFRYDLSPLFSRLHDSVKPVAVVDAENRRLCFVDAPRCYRIRVRARLTCAGRVREEAATLVLSKRGLERLEPAVGELDCPGLQGSS